MSRLPTTTPKKVVAALKRAGFTKVHQKGSHLYLHHKMRDSLTSVPMHQRDLKRPTLKEILKQAGLSEEEFRKLL